MILFDYEPIRQKAETYMGMIIDLAISLSPDGCWLVWRRACPSFLS